MTEKLNSSFFEQNRQVLKNQLSDDVVIVVTANGLVQRAGDSGFPFRQDSNFWYLTGLQLPDAVLVMTPKSEYLILPERNPILDYFDGKIDEEEVKAISGVENILNNHLGWEQLIKLAQKYKNIGTCLYKGFDARNAIYINPSKPRLVSRLKKLAPKINLIEIRPYLTKQRMAKQPAEIDAVQKAINTTLKSFKSIFEKDWFLKHQHEATISANLSYEFAKSGGTVAYPSIVAGGKRACTLHYGQNNQPLQKDELLLVDAGAEFNMYASDITRVYAPNKMNQKQKDVYSAVKDVQEYVINLLKPGVDIKELDKKVEKKIGQFLKANKLISKQEPAQIRKYYPHAVSHHLGLDVHDVADYSKPLEAGNIITVEPGIYIPEWNIGVRIEDDILITEKSAKNLSRALPS